MFIVYEGNNEIIITTKSKEKETVKRYFTNGGRSIEDYNRIEDSDCSISITPKLKVY
jgi:hypothetical protein